MLTIIDRQAELAWKGKKKLREHGFRASADLGNEKIGLKIREHTLQKVPTSQSSETASLNPVPGPCIHARLRLGSTSVARFAVFSAGDVGRRGRHARNKPVVMGVSPGASERSGQGVGQALPRLRTPWVAVRVPSGPYAADSSALPPRRAFSSRSFNAML